MYQHHRRFGGHKHGGSKYTRAADAEPTTSMSKPSSTALKTGKHAVPTQTADVASLYTSRTTSMAKPTSTRMGEGMPTMHPTPLGHGKSLPTGIAKAIPSMRPIGDGRRDAVLPSTSDTMAQLAKPNKAPSTGQRMQAATHKPIFWAVSIGFFVLLIAVILSVIAIKKRKTRKMNDAKTKAMMEWHGNQGLH